MYSLFQWLTIALVAGLAPVHAETVKVSTASGRTVEGKITVWTGDEVALKTGDETNVFVPKDLLSVVFARPASTESSKTQSRWMELADGSRIPFTELTVSNREAKVVTLLSEEPLEIPAEQIRSAQFTAAGAKAVGVTHDTAGDSLTIGKKDSNETETLTGLIGEITAEHVNFTWDGETVPVKLSKIAAIGFHQTATSDPPESLCAISLISGSRLQARTIALEGEKFRVTTIGNLRIDVPLSHVLKADYSAGKLTFLSDLEPLRTDWTPLIALPTAAQTIESFGQPRRDISFTGSPLALYQGKINESLTTYAKGLALRTRTEIEYRLPRGMRRFAAIAGIDPETREQGHVLLRIEVDGNTVWERPIDGRESPVSIDVDIVDAQRLKIVVDYGENLDTGDRLHLVEARLIK